jgi:hypothetical protein
MVDHLAHRLELSHETEVLEVTNNNQDIIDKKVVEEIHSLSEEQVLAELLGEAHGPQS